MNAFNLKPAVPSGTGSLDVPIERAVSSVKLGQGDLRPRSWVSIYGIPAAIAAAAHIAVALSGGKAPVKHKVVVEDDKSVVMLQVPPELEPLEDEAKLDDAPPPTGAVQDSFAPPQLVDAPSVTLDAVYVQPLQLSTPQVASTGLFSIPKGPARPEGIGTNLSKVFSLESLDRTPEVLQRVRPIYPMDLKRAGVQGEVLVTFVVSETGEVRDVEVVNSSNMGFDRPAINSVKRWRFKPGIYRGQTVATRMELPVRFELTN